MLSIEAYGAAMRAEDGWRNFYRQYPQSRGVFEITWAVLDAPRKRALVYAASRCGGLCGTGYYVLLARTAKGWSVRERFRLWIS